jgi:hypothetical protein
LSRIVTIIALLAFFSMLPLNSPSFEQGLRGEYPESSKPLESHADMFCTGVLQPPLDIQLEVVRLNEMDGERGIAELLLTVTPLIECSHISWEITAPAGLSSLSGQLKGTEALTLGERKTKTITMSVPDGKRYYLYAKATLETENGVVFTNAVSPYIDLGAQENKYPTFVRKDSVRGDVTTFKGVVAEGGGR